MQNLKNSLRQGDTLEILKTLPNDVFDAGVTSPPYNKKENKKGWLVKNVTYDSSSDVLPEEEYQKNQIAVLNELYRVTKPGGSFFYNHKIRWEKGIMFHPIQWLAKTEWVMRQEIIWDRKIAANIRGWRFWQVDERIYWLYKPIGNHFIGAELESRHALQTSIWRFSPERNNSHPAPFPLELPARALYSVIGDKKGALVIDPYLGSGTTAVAAKLLEYNYLGIDISTSYIDFAKKRIRNAEKEFELIKKEKEKHYVSMTFKERKEKGKFVGKFRKANRATPPFPTAPSFKTLFDS